MFFNRLVKYFLDNRLITFIFLITFVVCGIVFAPFNWKTGLFPRDPVPVDAIPDIGENLARLNEYKNMLVIPKSAVLWTGTRSIVYIKQANTDEPIFKMREIGLGPMLGNSYVITDGLEEGEEIVTQGTFSIDAAAQLEGKASMMNPQGGKTSSMPGMDMPGDSKTINGQGTPGSDTSIESKTKNKQSMPGMKMPDDKK